jgi:hypothetical protein
MKALKLAAMVALVGAMVGGAGACDSKSSDGGGKDKGDKSSESKSDKSDKDKKKKKGKKLAGDKVKVSAGDTKEAVAAGEDDNLGFREGRGAVGDEVEVPTAQLLDNKLSLAEDEGGDTAEGFGLRAKFDAATETAQTGKQGVIGVDPKDSIMVWRYNTVSASPTEVAVDVGRVFVLGGPAWQSVLLAVDGQGKPLAASQPPLALSIEGEGGETNGGHRFVLPLSQLAGYQGEVSFLLVSSVGQGVQNLVAVAHGNVSNGQLQGSLSPNVYGYLLGRKYTLQGTTQDGTQIARLLHFVLYDNARRCIAVNLVEVASKGGQEERARYGGCAQFDGQNLKFSATVMCVIQGGGEQCKKIDGEINNPLELMTDGIKWGPEYRLVPLEGGSAPQPQPQQPQPEEPQPQNDDPQPQNDDPQPQPQNDPSPQPQPAEPQPQPTPNPGGPRSYSDRKPGQE